MTEGLGVPLNFALELRALISPPWPQACEWIRFASWGRVEQRIEWEPWLHVRITWEVLKAVRGLISPQTN